MAYNSNPQALSLPWSGNLVDWQVASPGKWFMGVVDTSTGRVYLTPVNPFESHGQLNQATLNNTSSSGRNRYASGVPEDRTGAIQPAIAFAFEGNWLEARPVGQTHHTAVALHYGLNPGDCLGFSLIKQSYAGFAQMKCTSTSLNGDKPNHEIHHSFARATAANGSGFFPGSAVMPPQWRDAVANFFRGAPFDLSNLVVSLD